MPCRRRQHFKLLYSRKPGSVIFISCTGRSVCLRGRARAPWSLSTGSWLRSILKPFCYTPIGGAQYIYIKQFQDTAASPRTTTIPFKPQVEFSYHHGSSVTTEQRHQTKSFCRATMLTQRNGTDKDKSVGNPRWEVKLPASNGILACDVYATTTIPTTTPKQRQQSANRPTGEGSE